MSVERHIIEHQMLDVSGSSNKAPAANTVALLGDSITLRNHRSVGGTNSADFKAAPTTGLIDATHRNFEYTGWFHWANAFLYQRFEVVSYAGVAGHTNAQMYARLQADVVAFKPAYCFLQVSANGIGAGLTAASELSSVQSIVNDLLSAGIIPIVSKMVFSDSVQSGAEADEWSEFNLDLMQWLRVKGVIAVDLQKGMGNISVSGDVQLHPDYSNDGVHPNVNGAIKMGKNCYQQLKNIIPEAHILPAWITDYKTGVRNPLQEGVAGNAGGSGTSGTVPDFWTLSGSPSSTETAAASKVARTDEELGEWTKLTFAGTPNVVNESFEYRPASVSMTNSGFAEGDTISIYVEMEITADMVNMQPPRMRGFFDGNGETPSFSKISLFGLLDADVINTPFLLRMPDTVLGPQVGTDTGVLLIEFFPELINIALAGEMKIGAVWMQKKIT